MFLLFVVLGVPLLGVGWMLVSLFRDTGDYMKVLDGPVITINGKPYFKGDVIPEPEPVEVDAEELVRRIEARERGDWESEFKALLPPPEPFVVGPECTCETEEIRSMSGAVFRVATWGTETCTEHKDWNLDPWELTTGTEGVR